MKSNVTIEITENATVLGSLNFDEYCPDEKVDYPLYQDASHSFFHCSMFVAEDCENIVADGPYEPYEVIAWNYITYKANDVYQDPKVLGLSALADGMVPVDDWQITSNICGLKESPLENIVLRNVHLKVDGGVQAYNENVPEESIGYPEAYAYGRILPAKGIYFRHVNGLTVENVSVTTYRDDVRKDFIFEQVYSINC